MKFLSAGKDAKPKLKEKIKPKSEKPGVPKSQLQVSLCSRSSADVLKCSGLFLCSPFSVKQNCHVLH